MKVEMEVESVAWLLLTKLLTLLTWPSLALLYPLYASFGAVESRSVSKNQQCLAFWVLFALLNLLEEAIGKLLLRIPFWPHVKGMSIALLVIPYFSGAYFVYKNLARPYLWNVMETMWFWFGAQFDVTESNATKDKSDDSEKLVDYQGILKPARPNEVQKNWSCAVCLVTTNSEHCLQKHFMGRKHKENEEKIRVDLTARQGKPAGEGAQYPLLVISTSYRRVCLSNLTSHELWSGLLNPIATSNIWCRWEKPEYGWIKLNTDGSMNEKNACLGGLFRDDKGKPLLAFVSKAPRGDTFLVELLAIWRGLVLASSLGIKVLWIESDSMSAVKTINREQSYSGIGNAEGCLRCIWKLLKKFRKYQVYHSFREANRAADYLSRMIFDKPDVVLSPADLPCSLWRIMKEDSSGKLYLNSALTNCSPRRQPNCRMEARSCPKFYD